MKYLQKLKLADPVQQILLEEYVMRIELGSQCVQRLEEHMEERLKTWDRQPYVQTVMAFRGFQIVSIFPLRVYDQIKRREGLHDSLQLVDVWKRDHFF